MTTGQQTLKIEIPPKFAPLLQRKRYKGAWGGRGGAKSHFFARQLIKRCARKHTRAVCIREVQNSIKDSVRQLLIDAMKALGAENHFEILDSEIRGRLHGSLIIFRGMQSYNAANIKSLEGYDIAWVEEAQTLSAESWRLLKPTIRKDGSEIWCSWNPNNPQDAVDRFFRKEAVNDPDAVCVQVNHRDNPWFPEELRKEMERDKRVDPDTAEHVWEGGYGLAEGAILARWVSRAERENRIHLGVEFDPSGPFIEISSDIGFRDTSSWWFWQRQIGGYKLLGYLGDKGLDAQDWIEQLKLQLEDNHWPLGRIWLPHDARNKVFQSKHSALEQFIAAFGMSQVGIVPVTTKLHRIESARSVIAKCEFHSTRCEAGLDGLRAWQFEWNPDDRVFSKDPLHNWASHPSDGFSYGAQVMETMPPPETKKPPAAKFWSDQPIEELWKGSDERDRGRV